MAKEALDAILEAEAMGKAKKNQASQRSAVIEKEAVQNGEKLLEKAAAAAKAQADKIIKDANAKGCIIVNEAKLLAKTKSESLRAGIASKEASAVKGALEILSR